MYVSFEEYQMIFNGAIPAKEWQRVALKACAYIDRITFDRIKGCTDIPQEVKLAVCAAAESFYLEQNTIVSNQIKSFNNDGYSENYYTPTESAKFHAGAREDEVGLYLPRSHPLRYKGV